MKTIHIIFIGLLLIVGCGTRYHTLTLINEAQTPMSAMLFTNNQKMTAYSGETEYQVFRTDVYDFTLCVTLYGAETLTIHNEYTIDLNHDMICTISDTGEPITWE